MSFFGIIKQYGKGEPVQAPDPGHVELVYYSPSEGIFSFHGVSFKIPDDKLAHDKINHGMTVLAGIFNEANRREELAREDYSFIMCDDECCKDEVHRTAIHKGDTSWSSKIVGTMGEDSEKVHVKNIILLKIVAERSVVFNKDKLGICDREDVPVKVAELESQYVTKS